MAALALRKKFIIRDNEAARLRLDQFSKCSAKVVAALCANKFDLNPYSLSSHKRIVDLRIIRVNASCDR